MKNGIFEFQSSIRATGSQLLFSAARHQIEKRNRTEDNAHAAIIHAANLIAVEIARNQFAGVGKDGELLAELSGEDVVRRGMATHSPAGRD